MAECRDGDSSNGEAVQGPMRHCGPGSSMRRRYRGAHTAAMGGRTGTHEIPPGPGSSMTEAVQGPMA
ncbi:unnamed protein product [Staurois parvus]|uniref:Uncharacterized protein n=1 Tax=Staurois parvus TaxID=386267 RepID=A0ABN9BRT5_9NEOB|nr:unnamed protein product [Staurois parvus]